ncbi:hypothetical protein [Serratia proteamaculans]|nr:hypothetical protein [Serratia proteamaculans]CAI1573589.1 Uncharacterised protein [Serratia proteamaculans]
MKTLSVILAAIVARLGAAIVLLGAVVLALHGVSGWAWFLFIGVLLS